MKKSLIGISMLCLAYGCISFASADTSFSGCVQKTFTVTSYYSPQSGQAFYYKEDFTQEKILNGEGYAWASGKEVFNGMLAGPASYAFGSLVYFPGRGLG